jgi:IclR family transcriptional regulator, acetate operon repressor
MKDTTTSSLTGIDRAAAILDAFGDAPSLTLTKLARSVGLSESTTLRYVSSLVAHGFLERDEATKEYRVGLGLFQLGQRALRGRDVRRDALPHMKALLAQFDETVNLALVNQGQLVLIESLESARSLRKGATIGETDYWHASALGKAILAELPDEEVRQRLAGYPMTRLTDTTIVDVEELLIHLTLVRARGYATDAEETEEGLRCVAAAIRDVRGDPAYAISVSGLARRFTGAVTEEIGLAVARTTAEISTELGYLAPEEAETPV